MTLGDGNGAGIDKRIAWNATLAIELNEEPDGSRPTRLGERC
jgi:hypothetical protein